LVSSRSLDEASRETVNWVVKLIGKSLGIDEEKAIALLSMVSNLKISQIVNPLKTIRLAIPKKYLKRIFK